MTEETAPIPAILKFITFISFGAKETNQRKLAHSRKLKAVQKFRWFANLAKAMQFSFAVTVAYNAYFFYCLDSFLSNCTKNHPTIGATLGMALLAEES